MCFTSMGSQQQLGFLSSPLTPTEASMYYHAIWKAQMRYVLPQCVLSPKQLHFIENKPLQTFVAKRGYDFYTMDLALSSGVFSAQQLKHLN
jgi:hypothetical protein